MLVQNAHREGAGAKAGISANDVIIAIDGLKATTKLIEKYAKQRVITQSWLSAVMSYCRLKLQVTA